MKHYHGATHFRFNMELVMETKLSFRDEVIAALRVARVCVRQPDSPALNRYGNRRIVECKNQLALLDAMHYGFIHPVLGQELKG